MPQTDAAASWPNYCEDDFVTKDYRFASGELMPELRLHYRTMGMPRRTAAGKIVNGVLLLQGNTGTGANWLRPSLADELYGPAQPLDATQYFFIMQDARTPSNSDAFACTRAREGTGYTLTCRASAILMVNCR